MTVRVRCLNCDSTFEEADAPSLRRVVQVHVEVDCRKGIALGAAR